MKCYMIRTIYAQYKLWAGSPGRIAEVHITYNEGLPCLLTDGYISPSGLYAFATIQDFCRPHGALSPNKTVSSHEFSFGAVDTMGSHSPSRVRTHDTDSRFGLIPSTNKLIRLDETQMQTSLKCDTLM